jgi:hypothetical protein
VVNALTSRRLKADLEEEGPGNTAMNYDERPWLARQQHRRELDPGAGALTQAAAVCLVLALAGLVLLGILFFSILDDLPGVP